MILLLVAMETQDLDSLFAKAVGLVPEWDKIHHSLVTEQQRLSTSTFSVPQRRPGIIRVDEEREAIPLASKSEPI
jgi:hypothetical protein